MTFRVQHRRRKPSIEFCDGGNDSREPASAHRQIRTSVANALSCVTCVWPRYLLVVRCGAVRGHGRVEQMPVDVDA